MVTTTVRLPEDLIDDVDSILSGQRDYRSRSHLVESLLQGWRDAEMPQHDLDLDGDDDDDDDEYEDDD